jgi:hypothetical protein
MFLKRSCLLSIDALASFLSSCQLYRNGDPRQLVALEIIPTGQTVFAVGQTAQFIAIGTFSRSPLAQDMTRQVTWLANNADVATINSAGLATSLTCTTPASGCSTVITATATSENGTTVSATSFLSTISDGNDSHLPFLTVYKVGQGTGTVTSEPAGITCGSGADCTGNFTLGSPVTLTAVADSNSKFLGWSSNCNEGQDLTNPVCTLTMQNNQTVGAIFVLQ